MANEYGSFQDAENPDNEWTLRGCVIRLEPGSVNSDGTFDSGGPRVHANSAHIAVGVEGVKVNSSGYLELELDGGPITAILATPDETLTARGIWCGPSGEASITKLRFYKVGTGALDLTDQSDWDAVAGSLSNVWLAWLTCGTRGTGQPSKADQALTRAAALETAVTALTSRVAALEALHIPGSFARFDQAKAGDSFTDLNTEHAGDTFAAFDAAYAGV